MSELAALLILAGALLGFGGALGLVRLQTFFERVHAPTMGTTLGLALVLVGSMLHFTALEGRLVVHEVLISALLAITAPIGSTLLVAAARRRRRGR
jgi:multicomponent K+:H+ antiporter subunit G